MRNTRVIRNKCDATFKNPEIIRKYCNKQNAVERLRMTNTKFKWQAGDVTYSTKRVESIHNMQKKIQTTVEQVHVQRDLLCRVRRAILIFSV